MKCLTFEFVDFNSDAQNKAKGEAEIEIAAKSSQIGSKPFWGDRQTRDAIVLNEPCRHLVEGLLYHFDAEINSQLSMCS